jgi:DNA-binding MarR family transcriptional regulator
VKDTAQDRWGKVPGTVFAQSDAAVKLYGWLSCRYGGYAEIHPRVSTLAEQLHWSPDKVRRTLAELEKSGWVSQVRRPGHSSIYKLTSE